MMSTGKSVSPEWGRLGPYLFVLVLLLGAFLRLYNLGTPYISEDEAFHAVVASQWAETGSPLPPSGRAYTRGMPVIALEMLSLRYLPVELETAVRLPSALLGILNIWLFFLLGRRYGGWGVGVIAAAIFAISPWCIAIGTMARMYELLLTSSLLCLLSYERLSERPNGRNFVLLTAALCLAMTAHALGILLVLLPLAGVLVHLRQPRLAFLLGIAAVSQVLFRQVYPAILQWLVPSRMEFVDGPSGDTFIKPLFGLQQIEGQTMLLAWLAGAVVLLVGAALVVRRGGRGDILYLLPWAALILAFGIAGFLVISGLSLAAFIALSDVWRKPETARIQRLYMTGLFLGVLALWVVLAVLVPLARGMFSLSAMWAVLEPTIRFPEIAFEAFRPLLIDPRTTVLFHAGLAALTLVLARVLWKGPLLPGHPSLAARILFLLGAVAVVGVVDSAFTTSRYVYLMFPAALLSLLQIMKAYWQVSAKPTRASLAAVGLLLLFFSELPRALGQIPDSEGRRHLAARVAWLPDYFGGEERTKRRRDWRQLDYRAAATVLRDRMQPDDLLLADAVHQLQVYLPAVPIEGHLTARHAQFEVGEKHYFTGSAMLRTFDEMARFLRAHSDVAPTRSWIVLTGYSSLWQDTLPSRLAEKKVWSEGDIAIYSTDADDLLSIVQSAESDALSELRQSEDDHPADLQ